VTPTPHLTLGMLLTAAAGFADVIGFIELGGHFTSFMSGNTTQLGAALIEGGWGVAVLTASLIALFFLGGVAGSLLALLAGPRFGSAAVTALVLASFVATLICAYLGFAADQFMLILAAGAGAQNAILAASGTVRLGTTYVTGTVFTAAQDLARAIRRQAPPWRWVQHLLVWASLLCGGVLGALGYALLGINSLFLPAVVYLGFLLAFMVRRPASVVGE
jgi:uncharacterized membrane protein YoaK (UPF0700 family)